MSDGQSHTLRCEAQEYVCHLCRRRWDVGDPDAQRPTCDATAAPIAYSWKTSKTSRFSKSR